MRITSFGKWISIVRFTVKVSLSTEPETILGREIPRERQHSEAAAVFRSAEATFQSLYCKYKVRVTLPSSLPSCLHLSLLSPLLTSSYFFFPSHFHGIKEGTEFPHLVHMKGGGDKHRSATIPDCNHNRSEVVATVTSKDSRHVIFELHKKDPNLLSLDVKRQVLASWPLSI